MKEAVTSITVVMPEIMSDRKSENDSRGLAATPNPRRSSVLSVGEQTTDVKEASVATENDSCGLGASPNPRRSTVLPVGEQTTEVKEVSVAIPEFDPERDFCMMPKWMRFDSKLKGAMRYSCLICDTLVPPLPQDVQNHADGKKHMLRLDKYKHLCYKSVTPLSTLIERSKRQLLLFTHENMLMMPECLQSLRVHEADAVSVGFAAEDGYIRCLCFVTETICVNIDRSILSNTDTLRNMLEFKDVFEDSCILGGGDIWELMCVLYNTYGIKCNALREVDVCATEDAGESLPSVNAELHLQVATKALKSFDGMDVSTTRLFSVQTIPDHILEQICDLNTLMYRVYQEVRNRTLTVGYSKCLFNNSGTACRIVCDDYVSRIREKSLLYIDFGDLVLPGRCVEWDCSKTGKQVDVLLDSKTDKRRVKRIGVNRRREKMMLRVLLRHFIQSICIRDFEFNVIEKHFYKLDRLVKQWTRERDLMQRISNSPRLNTQQNTALRRSLHPISVIHGPPGTGKTRTLAEVCKDAVKRGQGVLCICWTNVAVLNLYEALQEVLPVDSVGFSVSTEYKCWHKEECEVIKAQSDITDECQVLCMTITKFLNSTMEGDGINKWSPGLLKQREVLISDEISQLWELIAAMVIRRLKDYKRIVLCGDDKQLPPYVSRDVDNPTSMMTWLRRLTGAYRIPVTFLTTQYRMMPVNGELVSSLFYNGRLNHHKIADGGKHLFFHKMGGKMEGLSTSKYCVEDSKRCLAICANYARTSPNLKIQVLTFYQNQCSHVKSLNNTISVCCVDSYQGQQADVIILLLTLRKKKPNKFLMQPGRLCVALSRAKKDLHIVGNWQTMFKDQTWKKIFKQCTYK